MKKDKRIFLDIHALQTVPPSCINRDDTGSPKTCIYGGAVRARVSSQCWKRSIRQYFDDHADPETLGVRTLYVADFLADSIQKKDKKISREDAFELAKKALDSVKIKTKSDGKADALFFIGRAQADAIADEVLKNGCTKDSKKRLEEIMKSNPAADIALFGRMVASNKDLTADASCQVAHAISVGKTSTEFDFFTAVDDFSDDAGMIGTTEFDSSTLYRYANIAVHELSHQLCGAKERTKETVKLFIEAFIKSMPTGKANSFANQTLPSDIIVCLRSDRPVSLVTAFEEPTVSKKEAEKKLYDELEKADMIADDPEGIFTLSLDGYKFGEPSLKALLQDVDKKLDALLD